MRIYAEKPGHAFRQLFSDLVVAWWIGLWVWIGMRIHDLVNKLAGPGRTIEEAGAAIRIRGRAHENLYLFALRAIATRPLPELLRATPDPGHAFATGDYDALAAMELDELGLRAAPAARTR